MSFSTSESGVQSTSVLCCNLLLFFVIIADQDFVTHTHTQNKILASFSMCMYSRQEVILFFVQFATTTLNLRHNK